MMTKKSLLAVSAVVLPGVLMLLGNAVASGSVSLTLKQSSDSRPVEPLAAAERDALGDPLFLLVLKEHADTTNLAQIENLLQPDAAQRRIFVVDENLANAKRGQSRRSVMTFSGSNGAVSLAGNVMLSVTFRDTDFPDTPSDIEAWGWDGTRGRYNYYKLDRVGSPAHGAPTWKFRGSSEGADLLSPVARRATCFTCHINGGPVMKELLLPWNNWNSFSFQAAYLQPTTPDAVRWPVATSPRLKGHLGGAEELEVMMVSSMTRYARARITAQLPLGMDTATGRPKADAQGMGRVVQAQRLLRSLFVTTEFNLISAAQKSGLHQVDTATAAGPGQDVVLPSSALLNANLLAGGGVPQLQGLGIREASDIGAVVKLTPAEYKQVILDSGTVLGGRSGDANFAWFVPESSQADNALVDQMLRLGVVSPRFVAAALSIDLETPVLSADRARLLAFMPDEFRFPSAMSAGTTASVSNGTDELTRLVIAALEASRPLAGSPEARFLARLKDPDPVARLREDVAAYKQRLQTKLTSSDVQVRRTELRRLYDRAVATRLAIENDPQLMHLDETGGVSGSLLPLTRR